MKLRSKARSEVMDGKQLYFLDNELITSKKHSKREKFLPYLNQPCVPNVLISEKPVARLIKSPFKIHVLAALMDPLFARGRLIAPEDL